MLHQQLCVLFPVWELEPFLKVGGLGEVARSLPQALHSYGVDIRVVLPQYKAIKYWHQRKRVVGTLHVTYGTKKVTVNVSQITFLGSDIPVYLLSNTKYFDTPIAETFAVFAGACVELLDSGLLDPWKPDVVHCNDNHCGLIPVLLSVRNNPVKTLLTIHCISHQRQSPVKYATDLGIPLDRLHVIPWESPKKQLNFLIEGVSHATKVNTVSPTYLKEIQTELYGAGMDDVIRRHRKKMSAIINGIDYELKNPATNPLLAMRYSVDPKELVQNSALALPQKAKRLDKEQLQRDTNVPVKPDITVIGFVGRLDVDQKGIDVLHRMLWRETFPHCQFVIMGHGLASWEEKFHLLATFKPETVAVITKYDDGLASKIYAGCDLVLIPSHFEPCCLIQMNAMRYGAIPVARATGGLNDTITHAKNGFLYTAPTAESLREALETALKLKKRSPATFRTMVHTAMATDFSWAKSAKAYIALYRSMLKTA